MTNRLALILFLLIVALFAFDIVLRGGETSVFLGKELFEFLDWIAFWR
ncbi:MAG: glyceraldehyde-3-phosphate dehydrogenase [Pseudomonadota bacterium]|nr:glyceraldehyde-3-phosphate dehydrogenase [Pseudomonadota bacterium]